MTDFSVNTIRVNNSGGRTLLANWVEERACKRYDEDDKKQCYPYKHGHKLINDSRLLPRAFWKWHSVKRKKLQLLEKQLFEKLSSKVQEEFHPPPQLPDYRSVTKKDFFSKEFTPIEHVPEMPHDVVKEQPLTYWSEKVNVVHGVSQIKTKDSPFRKNASFSTPVEQQLDHLKPYERWNFDGV